MTIPSQKKQVKEMALVLRDKYMECFKKQSPRGFVWEDFSKHVLGLIIQAQITSLEFTKLKSSALLIDEVIAGLKKDLQSLNPPKENV